MHTLREPAAPPAADSPLLVGYVVESLVDQGLTLDDARAVVDGLPIMTLPATAKTLYEIRMLGWDTNRHRGIYAREVARLRFTAAVVLVLVGFIALSALLSWPAWVFVPGVWILVSVAGVGFFAAMRADRDDQ